MVHGSHKGSRAALTTPAVLAIGAALTASTMPAFAVPVLSLTLSLSLSLIVLRVAAKIAFTAPLLPVSRIARMVGCIIHSGFTCDSLVLPGFDSGNLAVKRTH
jgi:hypothetical protein